MEEREGERRSMGDLGRVEEEREKSVEG